MVGLMTFKWILPICQHFPLQMITVVTFYPCPPPHSYDQHQHFGGLAIFAYGIRLSLFTFLIFT